MMHHHLRSKQSAAGHHDHHHDHHHKHHHKHHKHHHHEHGEGEGAAEEEAGAVADPEGVLSPQLRPRMTTSRWGDAEAGRPESSEVRPASSRAELSQSLPVQSPGVKREVPTSWSSSHPALRATMSPTATIGRQPRSARLERGWRDGEPIQFVIVILNPAASKFHTTIR